MPSNEHDPIPLTKLKLAQVPLYNYEQVILKKSGTLYLGNVVSHMPLEDWAEMKGYVMTHFSNRRYAAPGEKTRLIARPLRGAVPDSTRTITGMPAVARKSEPPPSSHRPTVVGIPLPGTYQPIIQPTPIKIIS